MCLRLKKGPPTGARHREPQRRRTHRCEAAPCGVHARVQLQFLLGREGCGGILFRPRSLSLRAAQRARSREDVLQRPALEAGEAGVGVGSHPGSRVVQALRAGASEQEPTRGEGGSERRLDAGRGRGAPVPASRRSLPQAADAGGRSCRRGEAQGARASAAALRRAAPRRQAHALVVSFQARSRVLQHLRARPPGEQVQTGHDGQLATRARTAFTQSLTTCFALKAPHGAAIGGYA